MKTAVITSMIVMLLSGQVGSADVVLTKYVLDIPALENTLVRYLLRKYDVKIIKKYDQGVDGEFMRIEADGTTVRFYGKYK